jgi:4-hydroxy-tetrahydrodipicolinate reductase
MNTPLRIVQYGLGPIGQEVARTVLDKHDAKAMTLVGAVDIDPEKVGRDVADVIGGDAAPTGVTVSDDADAVLADAEPDVVLHTTTSFLDGVTDQLVQCARAGAHVVSSTEELSFPYDRDPAATRRLDRVAKDEGVVIVGTGVNPGYAMDTLPLAATGVCTDVRAVHVERVVNASERRRPLQEKVGAGISTEAFEKKKATGTFGHIGLRESLLMVADGLGWTLDEVEETLQPVHADAPVDTGYRQVAAGEVAGIHHAAAGVVDGERPLTLDLKRRRRRLLRRRRAGQRPAYRPAVSGRHLRRYGHRGHAGKHGAPRRGRPAGLPDDGGPARAPRLCDAAPRRGRALSTLSAVWLRPNTVEPPCLDFAGRSSGAASTFGQRTGPLGPKRARPSASTTRCASGPVSSRHPP